ncbi:hypothetical protein NQ318_005347 [Aromia moschata]|uniref:protein-tyrosine-phosphatase n=1 Tax=Aromia moschata TaxID=1265417 RepID=A0AAV8YW90_9CUCU|nr:hypothetical protein NQ318_005347 [Aromia moschata]
MTRVRLCCGSPEFGLYISSYLLSVLAKEDNTDTVPLTEIPPKVNPIKPIVSPRPENAPYTFKTTHSKPIKINEYEAYVMEAIQNGELERQHGVTRTIEKLFPRGQTQPWEYGALMVNKSKNRYNNLIAYDHTRVKLRKLAGVEYSDYINANYIDGYRTPRAYIATQGPKVSTLNDFWRMIWQQKTKNIVMLANIYEGRKKKVERYWPEINEDRDFNGIRVQYVSSQVFADYEYRVFNVYNNGEQRKVEQLHFTSWPDHGIPLYSQSLVPFLQKMLTIPNSSNSPVVIHCSAGVGRTGTIILCDICLRMAAGEGSVDFLAHLEHLRSQRPNMVDNIEQYKLAHLVVLECLVGMRTAVLCNEDMTTTVQNLIDGGGIRNQMRDTRWQDEAMDTVWEQTEEVPVYPGKNRFEDITPVDGFRNPGRFIVTQQPMPSTLGDFWRLVHERGSTVVVSLNEINPNDETCCEFWPDEGKEIRPVDYLTIRHSDSILLEYGLIVTVHLIDTKEVSSAL